MGKIIDGVISAALVIGMAASGRAALKQTFFMMQKASLTKAAQGLPPLGPFAAALAGQKKSNRTQSERFHGYQK